MKSRNTWTRLSLVLGLGVVCLALAMSAYAQVQSQTSTSSGQASKEVKVERAEVVYVNGNDLVVKMEDGTLRHVPNVPESAKVSVNGQQLGVHDLKPGMKLERTITTTTTPKLVTTVKTVTGKVWHVSPPNSVVLTLEDGTNQQFTIPKGQKFNIDGQELDAFGLKKGMRVSATKVVEEPITEVSVNRALAGTMPPPPPPPADQPILIAVAKPVPAPAAPEAAATPAALPKTASMFPLLGLLGLLSLGTSLVLRAFRTIS